ncbi:hypothetical protein C7H19_15980 [Aphanothece hegewaldii CCALA 016]|uniref:Uncharacterized protein n=1 Tax=Aphanothece hegewaldii CCALA 016 TaxID=2107694 RepID=A0A2T1LVJ1_9CHRO|nr:hypothetical protein [Aphanothece hegewaldii]PSF35731.1 hypothetical protein C7H19_15980 [Aphanothece hegewaldii CCALA 016]
MSGIGSKVRSRDLVIEQTVLIEAAENLISAWDLPETIDTIQLASLLNHHLEQWLEDFCEHPDFFLKENSKFKRAVASLAEESELDSDLSILAA